MRRRPTIALLVLALGISLGVIAFHDQVAHARAGQAFTGHFKAAAFDRTAKLTSGDHVAVVSGPLECSPGTAAATVQVTLVRRTKPAPAFGFGSWRGRCAKGQWKATVKSQQAFTAGTARACALGVERRNGSAVDALEWCQTIKLVAS